VDVGQVQFGRSTFLENLLSFFLLVLFKLEVFGLMLLDELRVDSSAFLLEGQRSCFLLF
jgi:hypothetical protein